MASLAPAKQSSNGGTWDSFLHYYGMIVHQQNMLHDRVRTGTYKTAFDQNKIDFKDKVVVDVGTGTNMALLAAQAGAKTVYAIEASAIAENAKQLVKANGYEEVVKAIQGKVADIDLPEKVDVIISEPMGFVSARANARSFCARWDKMAEAVRQNVSNNWYNLYLPVF